MELEEFTGKKMLSGVDFENKEMETYGGYFEYSQVCRFRIDGVIYCATENPDDGYRSHMKGLIIDTSYSMRNVFDPIEVLCIHNKGDSGQKNDLLELTDTSTGKVVLTVGTGNTSDYYPYYVAEFRPENMILNADKKN